MFPASKVPVEVVRDVCAKAESLKQQGGRIRLKQFSAALKKEDGIDLSSKMVKELLIANGLFAAHQDDAIDSPRS